MRGGDQTQFNWEERFWKKVNKTNDCWLWTASNNYQYGTLNIKNKICKAHRLSWELHYGKIPDELHVLHHCDIPLCVNPDHLFLGSHQDNMKDMIEKGRETFKKGFDIKKVCPNLVINNKGERNGRSKLTEKDVLEIRKLSSLMTHVKLAKIFKMSPVTISEIVNNKSWTHI